jgi:hypothetical protein
MDFSALNEIGEAIITAVETVISLAALHAAVSVVTVFIAVWVMQATTRGAAPDAIRGRSVRAES